MPANMLKSFHRVLYPTEINTMKKSHLEVTANTDSGQISKLLIKNFFQN